MYKPDFDFLWQPFFMLIESNQNRCNFFISIPSMPRWMESLWLLDHLQTLRKLWSCRVHPVCGGWGVRGIEMSGKMWVSEEKRIIKRRVSQSVTLWSQDMSRIEYKTKKNDWKSWCETETDLECMLLIESRLCLCRRYHFFLFPQMSHFCVHTTMAFFGLPFLCTFVVFLDSFQGWKESPRINPHFPLFSLFPSDFEACRSFFCTGKTEHRSRPTFFTLCDLLSLHTRGETNAVLFAFLCLHGIVKRKRKYEKTREKHTGSIHVE